MVGPLTLGHCPGGKPSNETYRVDGASLSSNRVFQLAVLESATPTRALGPGLPIKAKIAISRLPVTAVGHSVTNGGDRLPLPDLSTGFPHKNKVSSSSGWGGHTGPVASIGASS